MRTIILITMIIIVVFVSCKKDNIKQVQVIEPGSYFPAYPNSWWKYLVNDSIEIIDSTSKDYILYSYEIDDLYHNEHYSNVAYVPWYYSSDLSPIGITGPIFKYDKIILCHKFYGTLLWPILSEEIGLVFDQHPGDQYPEWIEKYEVKSKIFNGHDSILVLIAKPYWWYDPITSQKRYIEFAKNVGLVKDIVYDTITNDTISKTILIDYHISK